MSASAPTERELKKAYEVAAAALMNNDAARRCSRCDWRPRFGELWTVECMHARLRGMHLLIYSLVCDRCRTEVETASANDHLVAVMTK
ncbi:hypothetical protein [Rhodococcus sp. RD6.2]|uniref:hypothetical protein n=1 Tax=Rhodococcus sp. RD6.2 TaxID=260936 RepID=UPI00155DD071|nr:hypothetical protein [Rhodococcus sp. RD6.2]